MIGLVNFKFFRVIVIPAIVMIAGIAQAQLVAPIHSLSDVNVSPMFQQMYENFVACGGKASLFKVKFLANVERDDIYFRADEMPSQACPSGRSLFLADPELHHAVKDLVQDGQPLIFSDLVHPKRMFRAMVINLNKDVQQEVTHVLFPGSNSRPLMILTPGVDLAGVVHEREHIFQYKVDHALTRIDVGLSKRIDDDMMRRQLHFSLMEVYAYRTQDEFVSSYYQDPQSQVYQLSMDPIKALESAAAGVSSAAELGPVTLVDGNKYVMETRFAISAMAGNYWNTLKYVLRSLRKDMGLYCSVVQLLERELKVSDWTYLQERLGKVVVDSHSCAIPARLIQ